MSEHMALDHALTIVLVEAIRQNRPKMVEMLLAMGANPRTSSGLPLVAVVVEGKGVHTPSGELPLVAAVREGQEQTVRILLDAKADVNARSFGVMSNGGGGQGGGREGGVKPLFTAIECRQQDMAQRLCKQLLDHGADPNAWRYIPQYGTLQLTALHILLLDDHLRLDLVETLVEAKASLEPMQNSPVPLILAAQRRSTRALKWLLEHKADVTLADHAGDTALHWAAWDHYPKAIRLLMDAKADLTARNKKGHTPIQCASASDGGGSDRDAALTILKRTEEWFPF